MRAAAVIFGLALAPMLVTLAGCGDAPASASYFPLEAGHRWTYELRTEWDNLSIDRETRVLINLGEQSLPDGAAGGGRAWLRRSDAGAEYWLREDASGSYRVASKSDNQAEPEADKPHRYVLKLPLALGTQWQASTTAYLLKRHNEFPPEIRYSHAPVLMTYQIAALGEALSTPAGDFKDCVRVQGQAVMKLFADPVNGFRDMPLSTTEWYCKGVGLARLVREEPTKQSSFIQGGKLVMDLVDWR